MCAYIYTRTHTGGQTGSGEREMEIDNVWEFVIKAKRGSNMDENTVLEKKAHSSHPGGSSTHVICMPSVPRSPVFPLSSNSFTHTGIICVFVLKDNDCPQSIQDSTIQCHASPVSWLSLPSHFTSNRLSPPPAPPKRLHFPFFSKTAFPPLQINHAGMYPTTSHDHLSFGDKTLKPNY